jgi:hypothetical protein
MDILVLLGRVEPPLIDPCARARTLTHRNSQSPLFFSIKVGKGERKILEKSEQENVAGDFYRLSLFIVSLG